MRPEGKCPAQGPGSSPGCYSSTRSGVNHSGPGDGKETNKHGQMGRMAWEKERVEGWSALGSHSWSLPHTGCHLSQIMSTSGLASGLCVIPEQMPRPLTDKETEAHDHKSNQFRRLGPRLKPQGSFPLAHSVLSSHGEPFVLPVLSCPWGGPALAGW